MPGTSVGVYSSTNNGLNWVQTSFTQFTNSIGINGSNLFAGTQTGIFFSSNNGQN